MTSNAGTEVKRIHVGFENNNATKETNILDSLGSFFQAGIPKPF